MTTSDVVAFGQRLIDDWINAKGRVDRARRDETSARNDLAEAEKALAAWLLPDDAQIGEKIAVWHLDNLIQVEKTAHGGVLSIRRRGRRGMASNGQG